MDSTLLNKGSEHYKAVGSIQPIEFILDQGLGFCEGNVVKYICRYQYKGTALEDLEKAKHYLEFLIDKEKRKA